MARGCVQNRLLPPLLAGDNNHSPGSRHLSELEHWDNHMGMLLDNSQWVGLYFAG
jgi:hypothetical protein